MSKNQLRAIMALHGDRVEDLARTIGIAPTTMSKKCNGKTEFLASEIMAVKEKYNLTPEQTVEIFLS